MDEKEYWKVIRKSLEDAQDRNRSRGDQGDFKCLSCNSFKPLMESIQQNMDGMTLCETCFLKWAKVRYGIGPQPFEIMLSFINKS